MRRRPSLYQRGGMIDRSIAAISHWIGGDP